MTQTRKLLVLLAFSSLAFVSVFLMDPIRQSSSFHDFVDKRVFLGIDSAGNVLSNLPFLFIGAYGIVILQKPRISTSTKLIYFFLFLGVILTGIGSAYYHSNPNNDTIVWDRIPMTVVFMSFFSATIAELINRKLGTMVLWPLLITGVSSVLWWHYTESKGHGDLRLYFLVQFYPMLIIPVILWLYRELIDRYMLRSLALVVVWYAVAKLLEQLDKPIYAFWGVSGHTLKHLAAAVSTWYFVVLFKSKYVTLSDNGIG